MTTSIQSAVPFLGTPSESKPTRVEDAAQQFESLLIHQMMRSAWESAPDGLDEEGSGSEDSVMRDLACQQFTQMLAKQGGIGMTRLIVKGLSSKGQDGQLGH